MRPSRVLGPAICLVTLLVVGQATATPSSLEGIRNDIPDLASDVFRTYAERGGSEPGAP